MKLTALVQPCTVALNSPASKHWAAPTAGNNACAAIEWLLIVDKDAVTAKGDSACKSAHNLGEGSDSNGLQLDRVEIAQHMMCASQQMPR